MPANDLPPVSNPEEPARVRLVYGTEGFSVTAYADEPPLPPGATITEGERMLGKAVIALAVIFSGWLFFAEDPPLFVLALCAAFPLVAIAVARKFPHQFSADGIARGERVNLAAAIGIPAAAMFLRAINDFDLLHPLYLLGPALAGGYVVARLCSIQRYTRTVMAVAVASYAVYPAGLAILANAALDVHPPTLVPAEVIAKKKNRLKRNGYLLRVDHAPELRYDEVDVEGDIYRQLEPRGTVCIELYRGAFALTHYDVIAAGPCPDEVAAGRIPR